MFKMNRQAKRYAQKQANEGYAQIVMTHMLSTLERMSSLPHKNKLKLKGKKLYRSSNRSVYRVPPSRRLTRLLKQRKMMRKLAQLKAQK